MRPLSVSELLDAWERGLGQSPPERALTLLAAATDSAPDSLARLSIGQRDARLLALRELTFGPQLLSLATCPACGERMELAFGAADLRVAHEAGADELLTLSLDGDEIRFRLPDSLDQMALVGCEDVDAARRVLLRRCLLTDAESGGEEGSADALSPDAWEMIARQMERADPQADVQLQMSCQACAHEWQEAFDIGSFFWAELDAWARRVLVEVHTLARAYGWPERDILKLSEARRQFYLDMVGGAA
jgi:hypothetical protein